MAGEKRARNSTSSSSSSVRRTRRKKVEYDIAPEDQISLLPDKILASFLTTLPIFEAARTSALSRRWRFVWTAVPHIALGDIRAIDRFGVNILVDMELDEWMPIVLHILRSRRAPLQSCHFKIDFFNARNFNLNRAFRLLRKHALQELLLHNLERDPSKMPPGTFSLSQTLQKLEIVNCYVILPPQFEGFSNLRTLCLNGVHVTNESFERLVSECPALEDLQLRELLQPIVLRIRAQKLQSMDIHMFRPFYIFLVDTPCLRNVKLSYSFDLAEGQSSTYRFYLDVPSSISDRFLLGSDLFKEGEKKTKDEVGKLIDLLMNLSNVESLSLRCCEEFFKVNFIKSVPSPIWVEKKHSMKSMLSDILPAPLQLVHLKKLSMKLKWDDALVISLVLFLLRSSPNLQELDLQGSCKREMLGPDEFDCWDTERAPECLVNHLTMVQIKGVHLRSKNFIGFVRFILLNACLLKTLKLHYYTSDQLEEKVVDELLLLKKASPQIVFKVRRIKFKPYRYLPWDDSD